MGKTIARYAALFLFITSVCCFSCKKKSTSPATPVLDSPAYSFFPGMSGTNDLSTVFTSDGNIAIMATSATGTILLYKVTQTGNELMRKEIIFKDTGYGLPEVSSLVQTADGGYMLCGTVHLQEVHVGTSAYSSNIFLVKLNHLGDLEWTKSYGGDREDYGSQIIRTKDGNYLLCGISYSFTSEGYDDIYLVKVNISGDIVWANPYAKHEQQTPFHLLEARNGDYIVTGTDEPTGDGRIVYLLRVSASGTKLWDNSVGPVDISHWKWAYCTAECANGDLMVCGGTDSKVMLIKTDNSGNLAWEKTYATDSFFSCGLSMKIAPDNGCVITGGNSEIIYDSARCFLLKTDADGNQVYLKKFSSTGSFTGVNLLINSKGDNIITGYQYFGYNSANIFLTRTDLKGNYK